MNTFVDLEAELVVREFRERFQRWGYGEGHWLLACHAAFPIAATPDMIYQIWYNFRTYPNQNGVLQKIDRLAVSDVLLWYCWEETDPDVFEMNAAIRAQLLAELRTDPRFGEERLRELARFLYQYTEQITGNQYGETLRQAQQWTAMATLAPALAAQQVADHLAKAVDNDEQPEVFRLRNLLETLSSHNDRFKGLLYISKGLKATYLGFEPELIQEQFTLAQTQGAYALTTDLREGEPFLTIPIPESLSEDILLPEKPSGNLHILAVGIDYPGMDLKGGVIDAHLLLDTLAEYSPIPVQSKILLMNVSATKANIFNQLGTVLSQTGPDDVVVFTFSGHGMNRGQQALENRIFTFEMAFEHQTSLAIPWLRKAEKEYSPETYILESELRQFMAGFRTQNPHFIFITDTHNGSPNWLDPTNEKHLILTAGSDFDIVEAMTNDGRQQGAFTAAFVEALKSQSHPQTYHRLIQDIYKRLRAWNLRQVPQLFGSKNARIRPYLSSDNSAFLYMQEVGRASGYYDGPMNGQESGQLNALARIANRYLAIPSDDNRLVQPGLLLDVGERFNLWKEADAVFSILCLCSSDTAQSVLAGIQSGLSADSNLSFHFEITTLQPNADSGEVELKPILEKLESAHLILFILNQSVVNATTFCPIVDHCLFYKKFENKLFLPILLEDCDWTNSSLKYRNTEPFRYDPAAFGPKPGLTPDANHSFFTEVSTLLDQYKPFFPLSPRGLSQQGVGLIKNGNNEEKGIGFLLTDTTIVTGHTIYYSPDDQYFIEFIDQKTDQKTAFPIRPDLPQFTYHQFEIHLYKIQDDENVAGRFRTLSFPTFDELNDYFSFRNLFNSLPNQLHCITFTNDKQEVKKNIEISTTPSDFFPIRFERLPIYPGNPLFRDNWQVIGIELSERFTPHEIWEENRSSRSSENRNNPYHIFLPIFYLLKNLYDETTIEQEPYLPPRPLIPGDWVPKNLNVEEKIDWATAVPSNRTLLILQLTQEPSFRPEIIQGLQTLQEVFDYFVPDVDIEFKLPDGSFVVELFKFSSMEHFDRSSLEKRCLLLSETQAKYNGFKQIMLQLKSNRILQKILMDDDTRQAFLGVMQILRSELSAPTQADDQLNYIPRLQENIAYLNKYGGFNLFNSLINGIEVLNPAKIAMRQSFLIEVEYLAARNELKSSIDNWISVLNQPRFEIYEAITLAETQEEYYVSQFRDFMCIVLERIRELEQNYRTLQLFFANSKAEKLPNLSILNASLEQVTDLDNTLFIDEASSELRSNYDRIDVRDAYSLLVIPGFLGNKKVIDRWAKIAHANSTLLLTDFRNVDNADDLIDLASHDRYGDADSYLSNIVVCCNWIFGREAHRDLAEEESFYLPPSGALAGLLYGTPLSKLPFNFTTGTITGGRGTAFSMRKTELAEIDKLGLIPMLYEYGKVIAVHDKTLFTGNHSGLKSYNFVLTFNLITKTLINYLNHHLFKVNLDYKLLEEIHLSINQILDQLTNHESIITSGKVTRVIRDPAYKDRVHIDIEIVPRFPAKRFILGLRGDVESGQWDFETRD